MEDKHVTWEKRGIELPPGWHEALQKLSEFTGVSLKYLYTVAVNRLLADDDIERVEEEAWNIQRETKKNLQKVSAMHTSEDVEKRYAQGKRGTSRATKK